MNERFAYDLEVGEGGLVAGADEAGRGSLAGPLLAAAVLFDYGRWCEEDFAALETLDDSKRHTRERREELYGLVVAHAVQIAIVSCSARSIDDRGLHRCNLFALERALASLVPRPEVALVDGFSIKDCSVPHCGLVGGDGRSAAVAAASIVAKVVRDRLMVTMHERWPSWGFDENVGYATPGHHAAILEHGLADLHRRSFQSVAYQQLELGFVPPALADAQILQEGDAAQGCLEAAEAAAPARSEASALSEASAPSEPPAASEAPARSAASPPPQVPQPSGATQPSEASQSLEVATPSEAPVS